MPHLLMLLSNAFRPDPRVAREAEALVAAGHRVTVLAWDRTGEFPARETHSGVEIERIQSVPSAYGSGWRQLFYTPRFWSAAVHRGLDLQPGAIHCHDLDTLYAGVQLKRRLGCPLVYDAHEDYPALMSLYLPAPFVPALSAFERRLIRSVDVTITASTVFAGKLRAQGVREVIPIGNYQPLEPFERLTPDDVRQARTALGLGAHDFVVAYIGGFTRNRLLAPFLQTASSLPDVTFLLWGDGHQRELVAQAAARHPNVRYLGWLPAAEVPRHTRMADVIYYCLQPDYPGAIYNAPNTLSNAMAAGTPIIANRVGDLGRIVTETGCGVLLDEVSPAAICTAIVALRDPALRARLGQAGLQAARSGYNGSAAARDLVQLYETLLS